MSQPLVLSELRAQLALFVRATRTSFAYRPAIVLSMLTAAVGYAVPMLVWRHIYAERGELLPVPARSLFPYLLLAGVLNFVFTLGVDMRIAQRIRLGLIATDLVKPVDLQLTQLTQSLSDVVFNLVIALPFLVVAHGLWGADALPASWFSLAAFCLSAGLALLIQFALAFIFVQAAFVTYSNYGIFVARNALHQAFSGLSAPLALFPPALHRVADWLPFRHTIHTPVSVYLGAVRGSEVLLTLATQLAWAVGLLMAGRVLLSASLRRLEIQGG